MLYMRAKIRLQVYVANIQVPKQLAMVLKYYKNGIVLFHLVIPILGTTSESSMHITDFTFASCHI